MKLKYEFAYIGTGNEFNAVPVGAGAEKQNVLLKLSPSAREIMDLLKEETTTDIITKKLHERYQDSTPNEIRESVNGFISKLDEAGFLTK